MKLELHTLLGRGRVSAGAAGAFAPAVFLETLYLEPRKWRFCISGYIVYKEFAPAVRES